MTPKIYYISATQLADWGMCREYFRRRRIEKLISIEPPIHREFGIAIHLGVNGFWTDMSLEDTYKIAHNHMATVDDSIMGYKTKQKWETLKDSLPLCLAAYYDHHEQDTDSVEALELEWQLPYTERVVLVGRIDRIMRKKNKRGDILIDTKTASEIGGKAWKSNYKEQMLRDPGLMLYDWYWRQVGPSAKALGLDVIIKPYGTKKSRIEYIDMSSLLEWRDRFDQQLKFTVNEMVHYQDQYREMRPWPMNPGTQCVNKYGSCDYLKLCNWGDSEKRLEGFKARVEHLEVRK